MFSLSSKSQSFNFQFKPKIAWMLIFALAIITTVLIFTGGGLLLNLLFPLAAFAVGLYLYFRAPVLYIGFTWWMWFLTPLVRRLSDWKSVYTQPSLLLLAPFLVTIITLITLLRNLPKFRLKGGMPYFLAFSAIVYGIIIGIIFRPLIRVGINGLDWLVPVCFGFHLFVNWRNYPIYQKSIQKIFFWGVIVMGIYGVFQFVTSPPWDAFWVIRADFVSGLSGRPENIGPFTINVWSTMSSNRPFAIAMMAGLILLLTDRSHGKLKIFANVVGYLTFLLARKRIIWLCLVLGLLIYTRSLKRQQQLRTIGYLLFLLIVTVVVLNFTPFGDFIYSRFETFNDLENDSSANIRLEWFNLMIGYALQSFLGRGIGGDPHDSAILSTLFDLGWLGGLAYFGGVLSLVLAVNKYSKSINDPFVIAAKAIAFAVLVQLPFSRVHIESQGMILWTFLSMIMAANKYYQYEAYMKLKEKNI